MRCREAKTAVERQMIGFNLARVSEEDAPVFWAIVQKKEDALGELAAARAADQPLQTKVEA
ncbi:hypothetical protein [Rhodosalinus sp. FB01]|uniref:hypothetical protein n=1 Tax=Rhodosalinus sp. FB01 TaxID=3239194 RepID=UPI0035243EC6